MKSIQTTPRVSDEEKLVEDILPKQIEIYKENKLRSRK